MFFPPNSPQLSYHLYSYKMRCSNDISKQYEIRIIFDNISKTSIDRSNSKNTNNNKEKAEPLTSVFFTIVAPFEIVQYFSFVFIIFYLFTHYFLSSVLLCSVCKSMFKRFIQQFTLFTIHYIPTNH